MQNQKVSLSFNSTLTFPKIGVPCCSVFVHGYHGNIMYTMLIIAAIPVRSGPLALAGCCINITCKHLCNNVCKILHVNICVIVYPLGAAYWRPTLCNIKWVGPMAASNKNQQLPMSTTSLLVISSQGGSRSQNHGICNCAARIH